MMKLSFASQYNLWFIRYLCRKFEIWNFELNLI